jgi:hypothetical protein
MDIRLRSLSYSSRLTLHTCPRKYQLARLNAREQNPEDVSSSVTFAYGHVVGLGIQEYITHHSEVETYWKCFLEWDCDLLQQNEKQKKSFWTALAAVDRFISMCACGFLDDWELCYYDGKPATELSFLIHFPDGFTYKGYVDAVLQNKDTGEVMVLECKTTAATNLSSSQYKNSDQAIGYSIVLDALFPELSSYTVLYLVYKTKAAEFEPLPFEKSYLDRAMWIRSLLLDIEVLKMYEEASIYPMHGESCNEFYRDCEYFGTCTLSTEVLTAELTDEEENAIHERLANEFQITLSVQDLIQAQLAKE